MPMTFLQEASKSSAGSYPAAIHCYVAFPRLLQGSPNFTSLSVAKRLTSINGPRGSHMSKQYDLIVIGAGTAAMVAATRVKAAGKSVAVVDSRPFGGTCALRGCDPKKMLVGVARAVDHAHRMQGKGFSGHPALDWTGLIDFKRTFTDPIPRKHEQRYVETGIDTYHGQARFVCAHSLEVGRERLTFKKVLIASGAEPLKLGIPGEEHLIDNERFLSLEALPKKIVIVGGGYIAAEFSHIAARAGAEVTILQRGDQLLKHFDTDVVRWLMGAFERAGIKVRTGTRVTAIEKRGGSKYYVFALRGGIEVELQADCVIHAAGRAPALEALNPSAANVAVEGGRLRLNEYLQSISNPAVYAAGDAAQVGPPLTPVSSHDAKVVAANILEGNHQTPDYRGVPTVAFTIPPIAAVGLTEHQARSQGLDVEVKSAFVPDWFTARQVAESIYGFKTIVDKGTDQVLGAHLVGPAVDEVINPIRPGYSSSASSGLTWSSKL
jgi:glutathione reductase (NADPH)